MIFSDFRLKSTIFFLGLSIFGFLLPAQTTEWSISESVKGRIIYSEVFGEIDNYFYIVKYDKKSRRSFIIEKFSNDMKMVKDYFFKVAKDVNVEKFIIMNKNIYIFYSFYDSKRKVYGLFVNLVDEDLEIIKKDQFVTSTNYSMENDVFIIKKDEYAEKFNILSANEITKTDVFYKIVVLNPSLNEVYSDRFSVSSNENDNPEQINFADSSIVFLFKKKESYKNPRLKKDLWKLLYYNYYQKKSLAFYLFNDTMRFANVQYKFNPINKTICIAGFYSMANSDRLDGLAVFSLFLAKDSTSLFLAGFGHDMLTSINGKSNEQGIIEFYPKSIVFRSDGGIIFLAEYFTIKSETYFSYYSVNSSSYVKYYYLYGDILITSLNPDGQIDWTKLVRKEQISMSDEGYYSSFITSVMDDKIILLYNDLNKNKWNLIYNKIDPKGEIEKQVLINGKLFDGYLIPKIGKQVKDNVILIPGFHRKKGFTLLKITL